MSERPAVSVIECSSPAPFFFGIYRLTLSRWDSALDDRELDVCALIDWRTRRNHRRAHVNSTPRIASPIGITTRAGPGVTIITTPSARTVLPKTPTAIRSAILYVE